LTWPSPSASSLCTYPPLTPPLPLSTHPPTNPSLCRYGLGAFISWRAYSLVCAAVPLIIFIILLFVPDSPHFLIEKGDERGAAEALRRFRGATVPAQVQPELDEVRLRLVPLRSEPRRTSSLSLSFS
jgi:hypothetical protein